MTHRGIRSASDAYADDTLFCGSSFIDTPSLHVNMSAFVAAVSLWMRSNKLQLIELNTAKTDSFILWCATSRNQASTSDPQNTVRIVERIRQCAATYRDNNLDSDFPRGHNHARLEDCVVLLRRAACDPRSMSDPFCSPSLSRSS